MSGHHLEFTVTHAQLIYAHAHATVTTHFATWKEVLINSWTIRGFSCSSSTGEGKRSHLVRFQHFFTNNYIFFKDMDPVPPKIVIEPPPQDATANIRRYSAGRSKIFYPHYQKNRVIAGKTLVRTPLEEIEELDESGTAFAKLVKTVQFIKKWAGKAEEPIHGREEFLERFKMSGPIIEENNTESSEEEEEEKSATNNVKCSKKFFQLNPMGTVLYG